ncbi:hypothetical protein EDD94_3762 [Streptomyces sp. PanSC9]|nr:hypothetical protein EDD94_3762 [Streptomyces sp. PanSC9]
MHGDRRTRGRAGRVRAVGDHRPHHLVTEDQRLAKPEVPDPAVPPVVQIGPAHPAVPDGHERLAGPRFGSGQLRHPEVARAVDHTTQHTHRPLHSTLVIPPSTYSTCPPTKSAAGEARKSSPPTRSSVRPQRPAGVRPRTHVLNSSSATRGRVSSVSM